MFALHIPKNTGFIYFRKNEPSAKIHIATGAYRKKSQSDSTGNTLKASCPKAALPKMVQTLLNYYHPSGGCTAIYGKA